MYEIISLFGQPFEQTQYRPERSPSFSIKRVGKALLLVFGVVAVLALAGGWLAYGNSLPKVVAGMLAVVMH